MGIVWRWVIRRIIIARRKASAAGKRESRYLLRSRIEEETWCIADHNIIYCIIHATEKYRCCKTSSTAATASKIKKNRGCQPRRASLVLGGASAKIFRKVKSNHHPDIAMHLELSSSLKLHLCTSLWTLRNSLTHSVSMQNKSKCLLQRLVSYRKLQ